VIIENVGENNIGVKILQIVGCYRHQEGIPTWFRLAEEKAPLRELSILGI